MKMDEEEDDRPFFFPNPDGNYAHSYVHNYKYTHIVYIYACTHTHIHLVFASRFP